MFSRIIVNNIRFNGLNFLGNPNMNISGGYLCVKEFGFFETPTVTEVIKYAGRHGEYVGPTHKKNRQYRIVFDIIAHSETERWEWLKKIQRAFSPENNPSPTNPNLWKPLSFVDPQGKKREVEAQIFSPLQLSDFGAGIWSGQQAILISRTPNISSQEIHSIVDRNHRLGWEIPFSLPFVEEYNLTKINYTGVLSSPVDVKITIKSQNATPLKLLNIISQNFSEFRVLQLEGLDLSYGDILYFNGQLQTVELTKSNTNPVDVTGLMSLSSARPTLEIGENILTCDCDREDEVLEVERIWRDVF